VNRIDLPTVTRVLDSDGDYSHIEPPISDDWTDLEKLAWQTAVLALDTGLHISLSAGESRRTGDTGCTFSVGGLHGFGIGTSSMTIAEAHSYLMGVRHGVEATQREG